jgi:hypothetical protein
VTAPPSLGFESDGRNLHKLHQAGRIPGGRKWESKGRRTGREEDRDDDHEDSEHTGEIDVTTTATANVNDQNMHDAKTRKM